MTTTSLIIKRSIKSAASLAKAGFGLPPTAPGSVNIIAYHRVVADIAKAERDAIYGIVISTATFRKHCELLNRSYDVVSLETAMHFLDDKRTVARPMAVITFDDGYLDFYEEAFPVLNEFGLPATVFLPTDCIGKNKPLAHDRIFWLLKLALEKLVPMDDALRKAVVNGDIAKEFNGVGNLLKMTDLLVYLPNEVREKIIRECERELGNKFEEYPPEYQLLNWDMVREMARKGINFGSHTVNHVVLPLENESVIRSEIERSKKTLENEIEKKVVSFAYPNGEYNAAIRQITEDAGYSVAVTTENRINRSGDDLLALGRTSLCEESTRGIGGRYSEGVAAVRLGV